MVKAFKDEISFSYLNQLCEDIGSQDSDRGGWTNKSPVAREGKDKTQDSDCLTNFCPSALSP